MLSRKRRKENRPCKEALMVSRLLFGVTLSFAILGLLCTLEAVQRCPWVIGPDAPINCLALEFQLFCLGPYLALGVVAWRWRKRQPTALKLCLGALTLFA